MFLPPLEKKVSFSDGVNPNDDLGFKPSATFQNHDQTVSSVAFEFHFFLLKMDNIFSMFSLILDLNRPIYILNQIHGLEITSTIEN